MLIILVNGYILVIYLLPRTKSNLSWIIMDLINFAVSSSIPAKADFGGNGPRAGLEATFLVLRHGLDAFADLDDLLDLITRVWERTRVPLARW